LDQTMWNCIAAYHDTTLDALTKERPLYPAPLEYHTSEARALCMIHAVNKLVPDLVTNSVVIISEWVDSLGLDASIISNEQAEQMAMDGNITPRVLGSFVAAKILDDMKIDGWNYDGAWTPHGPCTTHCRPYTDTIGYTPMNSPWKIDNPNRWQPLIESNDLGFFFAQEHVTPHIGTTARPVILSRDEIKGRTLDDPEYVYNVESLLAIERTNALQDSPFRRDMIRFMDNKINIAGGMIMRLRAKYNLSLEAQVFYHYGYTSTEMDSVILAWKEKVRHDLIRPTSVIQAMGDVMVESFAGKHPAREWVPFNRVMPHAEYPSGSGCICLGVQQFIDEFLLNEYGDVSIETTWSDSSFPEFGEYTFENMLELREVCGESRLWGGMHFTASVEDSYELCDGVGKMGYHRLMIPLLGDGSYAELNNDDKEKLL
jgi:hypothetical protein